MISLKQRENEIQKEKNELEKSRKKTLDKIEYKNSIDQLNNLLNCYVIKQL